MRQHLWRRGGQPAAQVDKTLEAMAQAAIMELKDAMAHRGPDCLHIQSACPQGGQVLFSPNSQGIAREVGGRIFGGDGNVKGGCASSANYEYR